MSTKCRRLTAKGRNLGYLQLFDNPFLYEKIKEKIRVSYHHVNWLVVVPLPRKVHEATNVHNVEGHREYCAEWIRKLYCLDVETLFNEQEKPVTRHFS